ncbi:glycerol-3-phosphate cytidylyltransferase [Actinobacillus genomosp. 1]|uniref:glycerol-3-phosphate cytidylyltransferase n=1 Tax=Actinobacillus genomosp. 1 TaxID=254839 RepID=UPI0024413008|nr:glycerol-3-phosphate cytidylyltransferase [Actinobacillus genomosp. 1]WGE90855.1 glycerol-3-phosphate cytidylyltransferase [Actinobacillus genomosp. 1]
MKKVLTYGTFDLLHHGHIRLLERARALGDHLTVAISTDQFNLSKGKVCAYSYEERAHILKAIRYVDEVIPETSWEQKIDDVKNNAIDVFVMGDDWEGKFDFLADYCEVVYLPRTPDISTTQVKKMLAKKDLAAGQKQIHEHE